MLIVCQSVTQESDYLVLLWLNAKKKEKSLKDPLREKRNEWVLDDILISSAINLATYATNRPGL